MSGPILVFGAGGQLGQEILARGASKQIEVRGATHVEADVADRLAVSRLIAKVRPALVVNCAAYTAVDQAESEPDAARLVNVVGAACVARATEAAGLPLIYISTDYVFDGTKKGAYNESDPVAPINVYGQTKAEGETEVRAISSRHVILRTAWVYGRFGNNFLKKMVGLSRERPELCVVADQQGSPTATQDLAEAVFSVSRALDTGSDIPWGTYHFAGTGVTSWHGFARAIVVAQASATGLNPPIKAITAKDYPTPARRPLNSALDSSRFAATFGYRAMPWQARVVDTIAALIKQGGSFEGDHSSRG